MQLDPRALGSSEKANDFFTWYRSGHHLHINICVWRHNLKTRAHVTVACIINQKHAKATIHSSVTHVSEEWVTRGGGGVNGFTSFYGLAKIPAAAIDGFEVVVSAHLHSWWHMRCKTREPSIFHTCTAIEPSSLLFSGAFQSHRPLSP